MACFCFCCLSCMFVIFVFVNRIWSELFWEFILVIAFSTLSECMLCACVLCAQTCMRCWSIFLIYYSSHVLLLFIGRVLWWARSRFWAAQRPFQYRTFWLSEAFRTWTFRLYVVGSVVLEMFSLAGASTFVFMFGVIGS